MNRRSASEGGVPVPGGCGPGHAPLPHGRGSGIGRGSEGGDALQKNRASTPNRHDGRSDQDCGTGDEMSGASTSDGGTPLPHGRGSDQRCGSDQSGGSDQRRGSDRGVGSDCGQGSDPRQDRSRDREGAASATPLAHLVTFSTYGTWLHGDARGSVDRDHRIPGTPFVDHDAERERAEARRIKHPPVTLDAARRAVVEATIRGVCDHRGWTLHAFSVRTNHVHAIVSAPDAPEHVMNQLKSWCTRRMVEAGILQPGTKAWTRHGSTRYLWKQHELQAACQYVCDGQGQDLPSGEVQPLPHGRGSDQGRGSDHGRGSDLSQGRAVAD